MAVGDVVQFESYNLAVLAEPPLRGIVQVAGPPEEILWEDGDRSTVASRGGVAGIMEIRTITDPTAADVGRWMNRRVQFKDPSSVANGGDQARGIVIRLWLDGTDLHMLVRRLSDGLFYRAFVDILAIV